MNEQTEPVRRTFRNNVPLICGIAFSVLLFVYVLFPGFLIGLMVRTKMLDKNGPSGAAREMFDIAFCVPILLAEHIKPLDRFYDWQFYLVIGNDKR